jgi:DNA polymerase/3'-5' exonuclease PolX
MYVCRRGKPTSGDVDIIIFPPRPLHLHQQEEQQEEEEGASAFAKVGNLPTVRAM